MRITCEVEEIELENDAGHLIPGVRAVCSRCQHETESYGTSEASVRRCLVLMREECEEDEENYYVGSDGD
jgi:hypothetical protein